MKKITDILHSGQQFTYSFEVTPDVSLDDINNLTVQPAFFSITWHAKLHECRDLDIPPLRMASYLANKEHNVLLHISCDLLKREYLDSVLEMLREKGICNLFVVLGENIDRSQSYFQITRDLIRHIRKKTGDYFCIGVAGFPNKELRLFELSVKIKSGANFIITQAVFESGYYKRFVVNCQNRGIKVPIVPGIFAYKEYEEVISFTNKCNVKVSSEFLEHVKKQEEENLSGTEMVTKLIKDISSSLNSNHFHFFTLNKINRVSSFIQQLEQNV